MQDGREQMEVRGKFETKCIVEMICMRFVIIRLLKIWQKRILLLWLIDNGAGAVSGYNRCGPGYAPGIP